MSFDKFSFYTIIISAVIFSCDDDGTPVPIPQNCVPSKGMVYGWTISFIYDMSGNLNEISYTREIAPGYSETRLDTLEYDGKGHLIKAQRLIDNKVDAKYELTYDAAGRPWQLNEWVFGMTGDPIVSYFDHDATGRLVRREIELGGQNWVYEFEYDNNGNVVKVFYKDFHDVATHLVQENKTFDDRSKIYANVKGFEIFSVYCLYFDASKNNVLTSFDFVDLDNVKYDLRYNDDGYITRKVTNDGPYQEDFMFTDLIYECH